MSKQALTELTVRRTAPRDERFDLWDGHTSGLGLRVFPSGTKSFFISYRIDGERRRDTIGKYPDITLADARAKAHTMRALIVKGVDPNSASRDKPIAFAEALPLFITLHCEQKNRPSTIKSTRRLLERECLPKWRKRSVSKIRRCDINVVLDAIIARGSAGAANKARAAMSKFFRWCVSRDYIATSPCDGVEPPTRTNKRDRVLDGSEISAVWNAAAAVGYPFGPIVQLLLLTAQRRNEVAHLQWDHLDLAAGKWVIPATLTKNGEQQNLPLSPAAIAILENAPRMHDRFIFPARGNDETCFSGFGKCKARLDAMINIPNWTLHDLRRTAATGMAGLGVSPHVVERILNHTGGTLGGVAGIYNRFNYQDEMRDALDQWATRLTASKM